MVDKEVGAGCFIIGCVLAAAIMVVVIFNDDSQAQLIPKIPKPIQFHLYRTNEFMIVDQRPKRVAAVRHSSILAIALYAEGSGLNNVGWPNVSVTTAGGAFRFDCQTMDDARRFFKFIRDFKDQPQIDGLPDRPSE